MMYPGFGMTNWGGMGLFWFFAVIFWLLLLIDLALLAVFLWNKIQDKKT